ASPTSLNVQSAGFVGAVSSSTAWSSRCASGTRPFLISVLPRPTRRPVNLGPARAPRGGCQAARDSRDSASRPPRAQPRAAIGPRSWRPSPRWHSSTPGRRDADASVGASRHGLARPGGGAERLVDEVLHDGGGESWALDPTAREEPRGDRVV